LDYIPPELEKESKNKSGFKKHPKFDYIPDGKEGEKLLADDKKAVEKKENKNKRSTYDGDKAISTDNICPECDLAFETRELLEDHIDKIHTKKDIKKMSKEELEKEAEKKDIPVLAKDTKQDIIDKLSDMA